MSAKTEHLFSLSMVYFYPVIELNLSIPISKIVNNCLKSHIGPTGEEAKPRDIKTRPPMDALIIGSFDLASRNGSNPLQVASLEMENWPIGSSFLRTHFAQLHWKRMA
jgi:hypothetical protein